MGERKHLTFREAIEIADNIMQQAEVGRQNSLETESHPPAAICDDSQCGTCYRCRCLALEQQLEALQTIIAKLPKTKDGFAVYPGMKVYFRHPETGELISWHVKMSTNQYTVDSRWDSDDFYVYDVCDCYTTPEAAGTIEHQMQGN